MTPEDIAKLPYRPCVGLMLLNEQGHVFVGQRLDREMDAWQMPQGGVDAGETPKAAALRELWEETGLTADKVTIIAETDDWLPYELPHHLIPKLWKGRFRGQKQKWFLLRFGGSDGDIRLETDHPEFIRWKWTTPDELLAAIVPFKRNVYARVLEEFRSKL